MVLLHTCTYGHQRDDVGLLDHVGDVVYEWMPLWMPIVWTVSVAYHPASSRVYTPLVGILIF